MSNWIDEALYDGKPPVGWVDSYVRGDGGFVDGHFRTGPNESIADNLGADIDSDGIPGFSMPMQMETELRKCWI